MRGTAKGHFTSPRAEVLHLATVATINDRNDAYGDPIYQHQLAARMKQIFWDAFEAVWKRGLPGDVGETRHHKLGRDSAHAEAINMLLTKLSRIASSPSANIREDTYVDIAAYAAIAYEVATQTE